MQWERVLHAETIETFGPLALNWIEIKPATMLMIEPGTKKGEMRRGPLASIPRMFSSILGRPPMPEPTFPPPPPPTHPSTGAAAPTAAPRVPARPQTANGWYGKRSASGPTSC